MTERYRIPGDATHLRCARGAGVIWAAAPTVILQVITGFADLPLSLLLVREWQRLFDGKRNVTVCTDALDLTGYDMGFRTEMVEEAARQSEAERLGGVCVLTRSKVVAMASVVAQLAIRIRVDVYSDGDDFASRLEALGAGASVLRKVSASGR